VKFTTPSETTCSNCSYSFGIMRRMVTMYT
jgi:hypothetical protein